MPTTRITAFSAGPMARSSHSAPRARAQDTTKGPEAGASPRRARLQGTMLTPTVWSTATSLNLMQRSLRLRLRARAQLPATAQTVVACKVQDEEISNRPAKLQE